MEIAHAYTTYADINFEVLTSSLFHLFIQPPIIFIIIQFFRPIIGILSAGLMMEDDGRLR